EKLSSHERKLVPDIITSRPSRKRKKPTNRLNVDIPKSEVPSNKSNADIKETPKQDTPPCGLISEKLSSHERKLAPDLITSRPSRRRKKRTKNLNPDTAKKEVQDISKQDT